ncbi:hypothetical protein MGAD_24120 [Mycolicibacterium gadium]|uniref:Uncharacterized protein n=1 Tax=Mycolicibacterium gadium TaxID=1794 RepID=A0A7I7WMW3_MYCGU|nr:hypothetical protein MGAD_24120 [Mycolicibacterium gadium]
MGACSPPSGTYRLGRAAKILSDFNSCDSRACSLWLGRVARVRRPGGRLRYVDVRNGPHVADREAVDGRPRYGRFPGV